MLSSQTGSKQMNPGKLSSELQHHHPCNLLMWTLKRTINLQRAQMPQCVEVQTSKDILCIIWQHKPHLREQQDLTLWDENALAVHNHNDSVNHTHICFYEQKTKCTHK